MKKIKNRTVRKLIFLLSLFSINNIISGQVYEQISPEIIGERGSKSKSDKGIAHQIKLCKFVIESDTAMKKVKALAYHYLASMEYITDGENAIIKELLDKSYEVDSLSFCFWYSYRRDLDIREPDLKRIMNLSRYFVQELEPNIDIEFKVKCEKLCGTCKKEQKRKVETANNSAYLDSLEILFKKDQEVRLMENIDYEKMKIIDRENRIALDKLYKLYGFPTTEKVTNSGVEKAWYILHHSIDCAWNEKWMIRFLKAIDKKEIKEGLFSHTIDRFYNLEKGYCSKEERIKMLNLIHLEFEDFWKRLDLHKN